MAPQFIRILRTPSSERYLVQLPAGTDAGALELHFLADGHVAGTLILFEETRLSEQAVAELLKEIDDVLLPDVSLEDKNLSFTVVVGSVMGTFVPEHQEGA